MNFGSYFRHKVFAAAFVQRLGYKKMSLPEKLLPPESVNGMQELDRDKFTKCVSVPSIAVPADCNLNKLLPILKQYLLKLRHFKPVRNASENDHKIVLLHPELVSSWADLPQDRLLQFKLTSECLREEPVQIEYENYQLRDLLKAILPRDLEGVSSFSQIGHIVHVNLRDEMLPYKGIVGQVLLENVANCRTVVNKTTNIDSVYRNFQLELLAGENEFITKLKENGVTFEFDFSKVYWNSRLSTEHERIVKTVQDGDVVYDVFAGVGPFAIPVAKKYKCKVLANDLNPESVKWMKHNQKLNKIGANLQILNKDAKDFIQEDVKKDMVTELSHDGKKTIIILMNLPEIGKEFLKYFTGLLSPDEVAGWDEERVRILINVYCFVRGEQLKIEALKSVEEQINSTLAQECIKEIAFVRNVAPNKNMMKVAFYLPKELLLYHARGQKRAFDKICVDQSIE